MELVLSNNQGELSPLEIGMHALQGRAEGGSGRGKKAGCQYYAERGKARQRLNSAAMQPT